MNDQRPTISTGPLLAVIVLLALLACGGVLLLGLGMFTFRAVSVPAPVAPAPVASPAAPLPRTAPALKATIEERPSDASPANSATAEPQP